METGKTNSIKNDITDKPQFGGILRNDYKKIAVFQCTLHVDSGNYCCKK